MKTREGNDAPRRPFSLRENLPVIAFVGRFAALSALIYALMLWPWFDRVVFAGYLAGNASASGFVLRTLGQSASVSGTVIHLNGSAVNIRRGCDALEPTALLAAAMMAFPAPWRWRLRGLIAGGLLLAVLNIARIVTLSLARLYWPASFDPLHLEIWPVAMILAALVCWLIWAGGLRARKGANAISNFTESKAA